MNADAKRSSNDLVGRTVGLFAFLTALTEIIHILCQEINKKIRVDWSQFTPVQVVEGRFRFAGQGGAVKLEINRNRYGMSLMLTGTGFMLHPLTTNSTSSCSWALELHIDIMALYFKFGAACLIQTQWYLRCRAERLLSALIFSPLTVHTSKL